MKFRILTGKNGECGLLNTTQGCMNKKGHNIVQGGSIVNEKAIIICAF
jgi:hypothetical protein